MNALKIIGVIVTALLVFGVILVAGYGFKWWSIPWAGKLQERQITNTGPYRIQSYDSFYAMYYDLKALDIKLAGYVPPLSEREKIECRGLTARRADIVSRYNADAAAIRTSGQWRAADLPDRLYAETRSCD